MNVGLGSYHVIMILTSVVEAVTLTVFDQRIIDVFNIVITDNISTPYLWPLTYILADLMYDVIWYSGREKSNSQAIQVQINNIFPFFLI